MIYNKLVMKLSNQIRQNIFRKVLKWWSDVLSWTYVTFTIIKNIVLNVELLVS